MASLFIAYYRVSTDRQGRPGLGLEPKQRGANYQQPYLLRTAAFFLMHPQRPLLSTLPNTLNRFTNSETSDRFARRMLVIG
jgi:hypothetical protein